MSESKDAPQQFDSSVLPSLQKGHTLCSGGVINFQSS
jgi:hypothetical protein